MKEHPFSKAENISPAGSRWERGAHYKEVTSVKKKLYGPLLMFAVALVLLTVPVRAAGILDSGECGQGGGNNVTWTLDSEGLLTIRGAGAMGDFSSADSLPWRAYLNDITSVTIQPGVTRIGNNAFRTCVSLKDVSLPDTLTEIGNVAFYHCDSLETLTIPSSVTTIGQNAFGYCALKELTVPANVASIGEGAFFKCSAMTAFTVDENNAHYSALEGVLFDKDRKTLLWYPVSKSASEYVLPQTVTSIGSYAFHSTTNLSKVDLWVEEPSEDEEAGTFNGGLTSISHRAFSYSSVTELHIPLSLKTIGDDAFYECEKLSDNDGKEIGKVYFEGNRQQWAAIQLGMGNYRLTNAEIICADTKQDKILASGECGAVGSNASWSLNEDGVLTVTGTDAMMNYTSAASVPWANYAGTEGTEDLRGQILTLSIAEGITNIGDYAFYGCEKLTNVELPSTLRSVGQWAFYGCTGLTELDLSSTAVTSIGGYAFNGCTGLTSFQFSPTLQTIGNRAFLYCSGLKTVTIPASVSSIAQWAFRWCNNLETFAMESLSENAQTHYTSLGDYALADCVSLRNVSFTENLTVIGDYAFFNCGKLTSLYLPASLSGVGSCAFLNCAALNGFTVSDDSGSFYAANGVLMNKDQTYIVWYPSGRTSPACAIPLSVTSIAPYAFQGASTLTDVYYAGTQAQWNQLEPNIGRPNDPLFTIKANGKVHYQGVDPTDNEDQTRFDSVIEETTETGRNAVARIYCSRNVSGAELWCASYNKEGRFLSLETYPLTAGEDNEAKFAISAETTEMRLFVLDGAAVALCPRIPFNPSAVTPAPET